MFSLVLGVKKSWAMLQLVLFRGLIQNSQRASPPFRMLSHQTHPPPRALRIILLFCVLLLVAISVLTAC